jgi:predicted DNA-binding transcriptional regulator AlpA
VTSGTSGTKRPRRGASTADYAAPAEIADRTGLHPKTVYRLLKDADTFHGIPIIRLGPKRTVLPRVKFEAWLAGDLDQAS